MGTGWHLGQARMYTASPVMDLPTGCIVGITTLARMTQGKLPEKKKTIGEHNDEKSIAELSVAFTASLGRNLPQVASRMVKNYVLQSSNGTRVLLPNGNRHFFSDVMSGDRRTDQMHVAACIPSWGGVPINGGKIRNGELLHDGLVLKSLSLKAAWVSMVLAKGSVPMHFSPPCGWVV
jgi:hypothetical protein